MANEMLEIVAKAMKKVQGGGQLCLLCSHGFATVLDVGAWIILREVSQGKRQAVISYLCHACIAKEAISERVLQKFKDTIMPDMTFQGPMPDAGHA